METANLKKYLTDVLGREQALFTAKQIRDAIQQHKEKVSEAHKSIVMPTAPHEFSFKSAWSVAMENGLESILMGIVTIGLFCIVIGLFAGVFIFTLGLVAFLGGIATYLIIKFHRTIKASTLYDKRYNEYVDNCERTAKRLKDTKIKQKQLLFELHVREKNIDAFINETQSTLDSLYTLDIIFGKYRYFVAVASICEYFQSGRCDKFEGHEGAYNLYENELHQNIIIAQLSMIIKELQQIQNAQYLLYEAISESNRILENIVSELTNLNQEVANLHRKGSQELADLKSSIDMTAKSSAMAAYFTKETAKNSELLVNINRGDYGLLFDKKGNIVK